MSDTIQSLEPEEVARLLAAEFDSRLVKWKAQTVKNDRALAVPYVDARVVQDRLDEVLGVAGWQDSYEFHGDGSVVCALSLRIAGEWITREDVGSESEQPDEGDRRKAAFSDALKRAAVKFGVGRYLYRLKAQWLDYDAARKRFLKEPTLPGKAAPPMLSPEAQARVQLWREWLDLRPELAKLNAVCADDLGKETGEAKRLCWELVCGYARRQGWTFDTSKKEFVPMEGATHASGKQDARRPEPAAT